MAVAGIKQSRLECEPSGHHHYRSIIDEWFGYALARRLVDSDWGYPLWPWEAIVTDPKYESWAAVRRNAEAEFRLEGLLAVHDCGSDLLVFRLQTAPWNFHTEPGRFRGVGSGLLAKAVRISVLLGRSGRVVLEAHPDAEAWYHRIGLRRIRTTKDGLPLMEFAAKDAVAFASTHGWC